MPITNITEAEIVVSALRKERYNLDRVIVDDFQENCGEWDDACISWCRDKIKVIDGIIDRIDKEWRPEELPF